MNYIEAVRELTTNPKAVAITFYSKSNPDILRRIELKGNLLYLTAKDIPAHKVRGGAIPAFILREDFSIEYKKEPNIYDELHEATGVPRADIKKIFHTVNYMAQQESAKQFFANMEKLLYGKK